MKLKEIINFILFSVVGGLITLCGSVFIFLYFSNLFGVSYSAFWYANIKFMAIMGFLFGFIINLELAIGKYFENKIIRKVSEE